MDKYNIGAYLGPKNITIENYKMVKEAGIDHLIISSETNHERSLEEAYTILSYCDECNIGCIVSNKFLDGADINTLKSHKSFEGILCLDEPLYDKFDYLSEKASIFEENYEGKYFYNNLLPDPTVDFMNRTGTDSWEKYVDGYCEKVLSKLSSNRILSCDVYPLLVEKGIEDRYLRVLEYISLKAKEYNAIPMMYIQLISYKSYINKRRTSLKEINFLNMCSICYGFKNLYYFTYSTPKENYEFRETDVSMVDRNDKKTIQYDCVQKATLVAKDVLNLLKDHEYNRTMPVYGKNIDNKTNCFSSLEYPLKKLKDIEHIESEKDTIISEYVSGKSKLYMLVNFTDPIDDANDLVTFKTDKSVNVLFGNSKINKKETNYSITIPSGEAIIIELK